MNDKCLENQEKRPAKQNICDNIAKNLSEKGVFAVFLNNPPHRSSTNNAHGTKVKHTASKGHKLDPDLVDVQTNGLTNF